MKIVIFTDTYFPQVNGIVRYVSDVIGLLSKKNEVVLFAPGEGRARVEQVSKRFKVYWIPGTPFPFYEGYRIASVNYKRVSNLLAKEKPDVVHAHAPVVLGLQGVISARRKKLPIVISYHTHFPDYLPHHLFYGLLPKTLDDLSEFTVKKLIKHVFKRADVVTAPTEELVRELSSYGLDNVIRLPNGIDLERFRREPAKEEEFRKLYRIPKNKKVVLYLGRISSEKKLDCLLRAFKMIEKKDRLLLVVGGGQHLERFKELAKALGIKGVIFTGFIEREYLNAAYGCADIFASASDTETFGLTFVEAMYMGLPVVGVWKYGAKEVVVDEKTGILVEPENDAALADAMERLLEDDTLRRRMGRKARKRSMEFSLRKSVSKTMKIYKKLRGKKVGKST